MSDRRDDQPEDDEKTLIRGQDSPAPEGNDDATVLRSDRQSSEPESGEDDATVLRSREPAPNDDATVIRSESGDDEPSDNATILRGRSTPASGTADETVVRKEGQRVEGSSPSRQPRGGRSPDVGSKGPENEDEATILRSPAGPTDSSDSATILRDPRGPVSSDNATILRGPDADEDAATILRGGDRQDAATLLRGRDSGAGAKEDDATVLRDGMESDDDDRTILNDNYDDDSTVLGPGSSGQDTTYIASVGKQIRPQGNSEAGRLLKNRFVLEEKIGSGGMGDVYKALDLRQQEAQERDPYIAIKLLNENFARHKDAFLSLQRETSRTRGIPHPNIMGVYDFDREGDTVFMSMELLDGKPLDDYLKEHPEGVSEEDAWTIIGGISRGLMRAHDAGIVHSDFKPGNIFYTKDKVAKVFDFGIARAISNPGEIEADGEKTVFDAGSLGALTPTYASYEMLKGMEPSKSDDVYAVALVAYELFMGKHPYDRVPADKAFERGMKPKPVPFLKRRHWKALKKALELKGENRTQSIDEFYEGVFSEDPPYLRYTAIAAVLLASIGYGAYQTMNQKEMPEDLARLHDVMSSAKLNIQGSLRDAGSLDSPTWKSDVWHDQLATALNRWKGAELQILDKDSEIAEKWQEDFPYEHDEDIDKLGQEILEKYLAKINSLRSTAINYEAKLDPELGVEPALDLLHEADSLMSRVKKNYRKSDPQAVAQIDNELQIRLEIRQNQLDSLVAEQERLAQLADEERARREAEDERIRFETARRSDYDDYLETMDNILKCKGDVTDADLASFNATLGKMKTRWAEAYEFHYPKIVGYMAQCIRERIGVVNPIRAREVKSVVASYLPGESEISSIVIENKDPCDERGLVGRGDRNRNWCADDLFEGGAGPDLVVVPPEGLSDRKYAISRAEIRIADYNLYCQSAGCDTLPGSSSLPATNLTIEQAKAYTSWLTEQTGEVYRLPSVEEWEWAVLSDGKAEVDENINCTVDSRGVRLGEKLLNAVSGRPNPWGLYNFVGNAREWAVQKDNTLLAMGGAHTDPRGECTLKKRVAHNGQADPVTGFRVLREITDKSRKPKESSDIAASE